MRRTGQNIAKEENPYAERPRASLYNVIMRLRENVVSMLKVIYNCYYQVGYRHCLLIVKVNDFESKHDIEGAVTEMYTKMVDNDGKTFLDNATGLCCIMGNYYLAVL